MMKLRLSSIFALVVIQLAGCVNGQPGGKNDSDVERHPDFGSYWYQGKAELSSYDLQQARYGEIHDGTAVLIFVTEDFSSDKHVKLDNPDQAGSDKVNVLKLNSTRNFNTGLYPYSMMTSVFTPVDYQRNTLKVTTSSQEWCGHTFTQLDLEGNNYQGKLFSYFESEGSENSIEVPATWLEDELWSLIRLNPEFLPVGNISIIPGTMVQRLRHSDFAAVKANTNLQKLSDRSVYSVEYTDGERKLSIEFSNEFPFQILGWEDTYQSGFGANSKIMTTSATLKESIQLDYWNKNQPEDEALRQQLDL